MVVLYSNGLSEAHHGFGKTWIVVEEAVLFELIQTKQPLYVNKVGVLLNLQLEEILKLASCCMVQWVVFHLINQTKLDLENCQAIVGIKKTIVQF